MTGGMARLTFCSSEVMSCSSRMTASSSNFVFASRCRKSLIPSSRILRSCSEEGRRKGGREREKGKGEGWWDFNGGGLRTAG